MNKLIVPSVIKIFFILIIACSLPGCKMQVAKSGIMKDFDTGLSASYKNIFPEEVTLIMNNEVLNHTDIPLGESFILVNDKTTGLTAKNGKLSVGCSLLIKDEQGLELMNAADLFEGNDELEANPTTVLRCTVNNGKPMEVGKKYQVTATFWDKYGDGNVVNNVSVKIAAAL